MGKELLTDLKFAIFKNCLGTRPKMETNEPNVYPTILGGVSRGFWSPFEDLGARSAIFLHLKRGTFGKIKQCVHFYLPTLPCTGLSITPATAHSAPSSFLKQQWWQWWHWWWIVWGWEGRGGGGFNDEVKPSTSIRVEVNVIDMIGEGWWCWGQIWCYFSSSILGSSSFHSRQRVPCSRSSSSG